MRVGFIGAGNLTAAHASFLQSKGIDILLSALPNHLGIIPKVEENGSRIDVLDGASFPVKTGTIAEALQADFTFLTVPGSGHEAAAAELAQHDLGNTNLIVTPGNLFTLLLGMKLERERFPKALFATTTSPYASRVMAGTAKVAVLGTKSQIEIAASAPLAKEDQQTIAGLFPQPVVWYADIASIFLGCTNAIVHPPAMLWAKAKIRAGETLAFYTECVPPAVPRICALDAERIGLAATLGLSSKTFLAYSNAWYGKNCPDFATFVRALDAYHTVAAPTTMNHRYLTEDVKCLLVFMRDWAQASHCITTEMDSVIAETGEVLGEDLMQTGMTLRSVGLMDASPSKIIAALNGARIS